MKRLTNYFSESKNFIKDKFYDFRVSLHNTLSRGKKSKARTMQARKKSEIAFLVLLLAYPIGLFLLGYVYVNISSIVLAFQKYDTISGQYSWNSINNFKKVIYDLTQDPIISQVTIRSLVSYAVNLLIAFPLNIIFAFIIYKKIPFAKFFQVILFLPSILSSLVIALMFKQFVDHVVPELLIKFGLQNPPNLLFDFRTAFAMQIFFVIWTGFGSQLILYSGAMSRIPNTLVEAGKLDGLTVFKEFWYITLPSIYQTITIFLVTGIAGIFTSQLALFSFYGTSAPSEIQVLGYYFFQKVVGQNASLAEYPYAAAGGLIFTLISAPITLIVRYVLERFGPSVEF